MLSIKVQFLTRYLVSRQVRGEYEWGKLAQQR